MGLFDGKGIEFWHILLIAAISIGVYIMFLQPMFAGGGYNDVPVIGEVNEEGQCVSRSGADVVMCCLVENPQTHVLEFVPCDKLATQAILTYGGTDYNPVNAVCFSLRATNQGNVDMVFDITIETTSNIAGGDPAGVAEMSDAWSNLLLAPVSPGIAPTLDYTFSMDCINNPIRIDTSATNPVGPFTMTDGTYQTVITTEATSVKSSAKATQDTTITFGVAQESLGFTVEVTRS